MVKIIIVDTYELPRGIDVVEQLRDISERYKDIDLEVECIYRYCEDYKQINEVEKIEKDDNIGIRIRPICLYNFFETLDEYYNNENESYVFLIHFASGNVFLRGHSIHPSERYSVRYMQRYCCPDNLWLYTGDSPNMIENARFYTNNHVLEFCRSSKNASNHLELDFEDNEIFMNQLRQKNNDLKLIKQNLANQDSRKNQDS